MAFGSLRWALKWGIIAAVTICVIQYWITTKSYVFTEEDVAAIAKKYVGKYKIIRLAKHLVQFPRHVRKGVGIGSYFL